MKFKVDETDQAILARPEIQEMLTKDFAEARAVASGSVRLSLDVAARNESAQRLYERRGMKVESQWPKRLNISQFRILRMTKTLS